MPTLQRYKEQTAQSQLEDYWIPLILLFTGARTSEICQLSTKDVFFNEGVWCLDINADGEAMRLKSPSAKRIIPIHSQLLDLGFLKYAQSRFDNKETKLFNLKPIGENDDWGKSFARRFGKILQELGFRASYRPTLHSLRHTFIDELQANGAPENQVAELVGHSKKNITYGRYGKCLPVDVLKALIEKVKFEQFIVRDPLK
jgi:integrase